MEYNKYQVFKTASAREPTYLTDQMNDLAKQGFKPIGSVFIFEYDDEKYLCMLMGK